MAARLAAGALFFLAVLAAGCSSKPPITGEVAIHSFTYEPGSITVKAGEGVEFTNHDDEEHSITADAGGAFDEEAEGGGGKAVVSVDKAGTYPFHCRYHSTMHGTLVFT